MVQSLSLVCALWWLTRLPSFVCSVVVAWGRLASHSSSFPSAHSLLFFPSQYRLCVCVDADAVVVLEMEWDGMGWDEREEERKKEEEREEDV